MEDIEFEDNEEFSGVEPPETFGSLEAAYGPRRARVIRNRMTMKRLTPQQQQQQEAKLVEQANMTAEVSKRANRAIRPRDRADEMREIGRWAKAKSFDQRQLFTEDTIIFHRKTVDLLAANIPSQISFFNETDALGKFITNLKEANRVSQTSLFLAKALCVRVAWKNRAVGVDPSAGAYISAVGQLMNNSLVTFKVDEAEYSPVFAVDLPGGGGAWSPSGSAEANGLPILQNVQPFRYPVKIDGGVTFSATMDVDKASIPDTDARLWVTMLLRGTRVRQR